MLKAIKIRLYPNTNQKVYINKLIGCYRVIFNNCLDKKIKDYEIHNVNHNLSSLGNYFHHDLLKNEKYDWLNEHNTKVLKQSIINMLDAFNNFFKNAKGYPKFKSKHNDKQTCRFPSEAISKLNDYTTNKLTLTKNIKNIKFKCSERYKDYLNKYKLNIKSATLTKTKSGKYFLSILIDGDLNKQIQETNKAIGIDLGIKDFIVTSDNERYENIKSIRNNQKRLSRLHKRHSKKQTVGTGEHKFSNKWNKEVEIKIASKNKEKSRIKLARLHEKIKNKKENYLHSITNQLINENQVIVIEDLNVSGMMKNHKLAKSIQELSLFRFKEMLRYKAKWNNRILIEVDRFFPSSKNCSCCGNKKDDLRLRDREYSCEECGLVIDRDYNAATNILNEGLRILRKDTHPLWEINAFGDETLVSSLN